MSALSRRDLFLAYLQAYSDKHLDRISAMFADDIVLRDWNLAVTGKAAALAETAKNFRNAESIAIQVLAIHESPGSVAGELRILVDGSVELHVVDVLDFDGEGRITSIRAYLGKG